MKKISIVLSLILLLSGCTSNQTAPPLKDDFHIVTSFYPVYFLTKYITYGAPNITVSNMTEHHTGCPHDYTLLPQDMKSLEDADIFIISGGGLETFMSNINNRSDLTIIDAGRNIEFINDNPHIWLSIRGMREQALNITDSLCESNPQNATTYKRNCSELIDRLDEQYEKMNSELMLYKGQHIALFHNAFEYIAADFGLEVSIVVEVEHGDEPTPGQIASAIDVINQTKTIALFDEINTSSSAPKVISEQTGLKIHTLNPITEGDDDFDSYFNIMDDNLKALKQALQEGLQ